MRHGFGCKQLAIDGLHCKCQPLFRQALGLQCGRIIEFAMTHHDCMKKTYRAFIQKQFEFQAYFYCREELMLLLVESFIHSYFIFVLAFLWGGARGSILMS